MIYHGRNFRKVGNRNRIKRRRAGANLAGSVFSTLGGASSVVGSAFGLKSMFISNSTTRANSGTIAGVASMFGSLMSFGSAYVDLLASTGDTIDYGRIKNLKTTNLAIKDPKSNKLVVKAREMAIAAAKNNYRRSQCGIADSTLRTTGSLFSLAGSGCKLAGLSPVGSIFGAIGSGLGEVAKIGSHIHNTTQRKRKADDRRKYVVDYLDRKKDKIKQKAAGAPFRIRSQI